jgi:hypothetical protein
MDGTTTNGELASFDQLVASGGKRRFKLVTLPICGLTYRIRSLFERELSDYQAAIQAARDEKQRHQRLKAANRQFIALCLVDVDGNLIVPTDRVGEMAELDGADSSYLYDESVAHVGVNKQDLEDLVGNSEETTPSDSLTS